MSPIRRIRMAEDPQAQLLQAADLETRCQARVHKKGGSRHIRHGKEDGHLFNAGDGLRAVAPRQPSPFPADLDVHLLHRLLPADHVQQRANITRRHMLLREGPNDARNALDLPCRQQLPRGLVSDPVHWPELVQCLRERIIGQVRQRRPQRTGRSGHRGIHGIAHSTDAQGDGVREPQLGGEFLGRLADVRGGDEVVGRRRPHDGLGQPGEMLDLVFDEP
mmetsp:Transcript_9115/g.26242  ORF Transcript_9115/g.26242 Transcript_9115/m.26242 type:complete len:220 (-) Transcript_9115:1639-2298(-)